MDINVKLIRKFGAAAVYFDLGQGQLRSIFFSADIHMLFDHIKANICRILQDNRNNNILPVEDDNFSF